jgi:polyisoprenoid-binding protein YceI
MSTLVSCLLSLIAGFLFALQPYSMCLSADSPGHRWTLLDGTTLLDAKSGLEWTRSDNGHDIDWHRAGRLCGDLPGHWRLPSADELIALYEEKTAAAPCGMTSCRVSGPFELTGEWFWSADSVGNDGSDGNELAWGVLLANGSRTESVKELAEGSRALCVRPSIAARSTAVKEADLPVDRSRATLPIDAGHTAVIFGWTHRGFSHPLARLEHLSGSVIWDRTDLAKSSVQVTLPLDGLRSGSDALDKRLRGRDFFDAVAYPVIQFKSTEIVPKAGSNEFTIVGALTVHGVARPVTLLAKINKLEDVPGQAAWGGFDADGVLRRSDFGLSRYVPIVSDEIAIHITLEAHAE